MVTRQQEQKCQGLVRKERTGEYLGSLTFSFLLAQRQAWTRHREQGSIPSGLQSWPAHVTSCWADPSPGATGLSFGPRQRGCDQNRSHCQGPRRPQEGAGCTHTAFQMCRYKRAQCSGQSHTPKPGALWSVWLSGWHPLSLYNPTAPRRAPSLLSSLSCWQVSHLIISDRKSC